MDLPIQAQGKALSSIHIHSKFYLHSEQKSEQEQEGAGGLGRRHVTRLSEELPLTQCTSRLHQTYTNLTSLSFRFAKSLEFFWPHTAHSIIWATSQRVMRQIQLDKLAFFCNSIFVHDTLLDFQFVYIIFEPIH